MRFPIHAFRRKSAVPDVAAPHASGSPPPAFSELGREEAAAGAEARSEAPVEGDARGYLPTREELSRGQGQVYITSAIPGHEGELRTLDMKNLLIEDYHAIKRFSRHIDWKVIGRGAVAKHMWKWYAIIAVAIVLTVLVTTQHDAVVHYCAPVTRTIRSWPGGWLIPLALLIIVSYPPLVGHEIIGILIGLVWGLGEGFAILAAGTFIGEIMLWFSFKWCCTKTAAKFERKSKLYWSLTQLIREKTFMFVLILRFSAIPGHIVTAVSASAGANYWSYLAAAFLTLPKQFTIVYLGAAFGHKEKKHVIISTVTMVLTVVVTGVAAIYIYYQMRLVMVRRDIAMNTSLPMHAGDVALTERQSPSWADVDDKGGIDGKPEVVMVEEKAFVPELTHGEIKGLAARRPWLFTNPSFASTNTTGSTAALRAWSVPHHMTENEMREFMAEMESGQATPMVRVDEAPPAFSSPFPAVEAGSSRRSSPTESSPPQGLLSVDEPRTSASGERHASRTTNSLDLARGSPRPRDTRDGREMADDADRYAYARRGRRPDYGRIRGESRAALLGRPAEDGKAE